MSELSRLKLTESIDFYRKNREKIIKIHLTTNEAFKEIVEILQKSITDLLGIVNLENLSNISEDLGGLNCKLTKSSENKDESETEDGSDACLTMSIVANSDILKLGRIENPAIAVIGQVKAGKSTFVNSLLKKNVVRQDFEKCTARITRLQYSEKNYVEILDQNGNVLKRQALKSQEIPKEYLKLSDKHRNNPEEINKQIVAGINSPFLKCGIDLIDSPGLSENETLNNMSKAISKNVLPVMIYVIDGCTSVKQTDISYLVELKSKHRNLQIIYFITKLDGDEDANATEQNRIDGAEEKLNIAFRKLQFNNIIPSDKFKNWQDCPYFHGASLYKYIDYVKGGRNQECTYHYKRFSEFELALDTFLVEQFCMKIDEPCETLINFHLDVLTKIIQRAQIFADYTKDNLAQIKQMKTIENDLYEKLKVVISESKKDLKNRLVDRLQDQSESIIEPICELEYPEAAGVPDDGMVSNSTVIQSCNYTIMKMVCQSLENIILQFVEEELFEKYKNTIEAESTKRMAECINDQDGNISKNSKKSFKSPYRVTLDRLLARKYKFSAIKGKMDNAEGRNFIINIMDSIFRSISRVFHKLFLAKQLKEKVDVKSPIWKKQKAIEVLKKLNHQQLAEEVCNDLQKDFDERHENFLKALDKEFNFVQKDIVISEVTRQLLAGKAPEFTILLMLTLDVKSSYILRDVKDIKKIGSGAQGDVYSCMIGDRRMARKTADIPLQQFCVIAEEIYYSYIIKHERMLMLEGIKLEESDKSDNKRISVFYPEMKSDVLDYIKNNKTEFSQRMNFGLQVAEALQYLHSLKIMHRDLKLANILLDENNNVYLADYGLCKAVALTGHSLVGTPVHIAPEIVKKELYDYKVDVFSFGILLWYLAEGTGRHPIYVHILGDATKVLIGGSEYNMRPERLGHISDELWSIMEDCWHPDKTKRPNIDLVVERLKACIN